MPYSKDSNREERIRNEIIVDAYDDYEVNMSWYYHFEENLELPFSAYVKTESRTLQHVETKTEIVKITSNTDEEIQFGAYYSSCELMVKISIADIARLINGEENLEILNDWLYWKKLPLLE